jgi:thiosulfate/3-mercaptopyruvate sulfurtransferase
MTFATLIAAETLAESLGDPGIRVFDCRYDLVRPDAGRELYLEAHLPGATYAGLDRDLSAPTTVTSGRHPLPDPEIFARRLREWGVGDDSTVVAYDEGSGMYAARLWWMLRWLGHDDVAVLDGGYARWRSLGLPVTQAVPARRPGSFAARPRTDFTVDAAQVLAIGRDRARRLLDARAPERYRGEVEPIDAVAGHVPGARNHPFAASLDASGRFRSSDELRHTLLASLDGVPAERTVAMCGSGVTACHLLLALEHAGLPGARLYAGSWSEWSRDPARPVATGPEP